MGRSSAQIDDEIASTRRHLDANLDVLQARARSGMKRAGVVTGTSLVAGLLVGGIAFLLYRRLHKPTVRERVADAVPDSWADFQKEAKKRFGHRPFRIVITSGDSAGEGGGSVWESTARKVAPTVVTTAVSALMAQAMKRRDARSETDSTGE